MALQHSERSWFPHSDYSNDVTLAQEGDDKDVEMQKLDVNMQEADTAAAYDEDFTAYLFDLKPWTEDELAADELRLQNELFTFPALDRDRRDTAMLIEQYEQSEAAMIIARDKISLIPGRPETIELTIQLPGQGTFVTYRRLPYDEALKLFNSGKAPVFDESEWQVSQLISPGLRYDQNGVFASTLRDQTAYLSAGKPETFLNMLPGELRNDIYKDVFQAYFNKTAKGTDFREDINQVEEPHLSKAIPSLRLEILSLYFAKARFKVTAYSKYLARGVVISWPRVTERGQRWGTGVLVLHGQHWIRKVDPVAVRFHHVDLHIQEIDGSHLLRLSFSYTRTKQGRQPSVTIPMAGMSQLTISDLNLATRNARSLVTECKKNDEFSGFSLNDLHQVVKAFKNPRPKNYLRPHLKKTVENASVEP